jgi:hypothetical protein
MWVVLFDLKMCILPAIKRRTTKSISGDNKKESSERSTSSDQVQLVSSPEKPVGKRHKHPRGMKSMTADRVLAALVDEGEEMGVSILGYLLMNRGIGLVPNKVVIRLHFLKSVEPSVAISK